MSDFETAPVGTMAELERLRQSIAPCVFHNDCHDDCLQHSGQAPCMTQTESDWLAEVASTALETLRDTLIPRLLYKADQQIARDTIRSILTPWRRTEEPLDD